MKKFSIIIATLFLAISCNETTMIDHVNTQVAAETELEQRTDDINPFINQKAVADIVYLMTEGNTISNLFHDGSISEDEVYEIYNLVLTSYPTYTNPHDTFTVSSNFNSESLMPFLAEEYEGHEDIYNYFTKVNDASQAITSITEELISNGHDHESVKELLNSAMLQVHSTTNAVLESRSDPCSYCHAQYIDNMATARNSGFAGFFGAYTTGTIGTIVSGNPFFFAGGIVAGVVIGGVNYGFGVNNANRALRTCLEEHDCDSTAGGPSNHEPACKPMCAIHGMPT